MADKAYCSGPIHRQVGDLRGNAATPAPTYDLLGVGMSILTIPDAVRRVIDAVKTDTKGYVCVTGMHGIMEARDDAKLQRILNEAFLCTPDGMPTVWLGQARGHKMQRVYGPDLMLALMEATQSKPIRHFFYGGAEGVAEDLKRKMEERFPGIQIVGTYCPPFRPLSPEEKAALIEQISTCQADMVWVGLSTPKQERFMAEYLPALPVKVMLGVGAAFDFHTGRARQAPRWVMAAGFEWFFRLITEPKRLWRRYCFQVPRFASLVGLDAIGLVSHTAEQPEMPRAFHLLSRWPTWFLAAGSLSLVATGLCIFGLGLVKGAVVALSFFTTLVVSLFLILLQLMGADEERLDRPWQVGLFLLTLANMGACYPGPAGCGGSHVLRVTGFCVETGGDSWICFHRAGPAACHHTGCARGNRPVFQSRGLLPA